MVPSEWRRAVIGAEERQQPQHGTSGANVATRHPLRGGNSFSPDTLVLTTDGNSTPIADVAS